LAGWALLLIVLSGLDAWWQPSQGCAEFVAGGRQDAMKSAQKTFSDAGFSNCSLRHHLSAATGRKQ
jgi:hypothetical protein